MNDSQKLDQVWRALGLHRGASDARYTQAEFDKLPALLPRDLFVAWSGIRNASLDDMVRDGELGVKYFGVRRKYFKRDLAKLGGWTM